MKKHHYHTINATLCGAAMLITGALCLGMIYVGNHTVAIPLGVAAAFFSVAMKIQMHDRRISMIRADWRREADEHQRRVAQ